MVIKVEDGTHYKFFNDNIQVFKYDENLFRFIISLSWRTLKGSYNAQISYSPWAKEYVDKTEETWRKYLLHESTDPGPYEHRARGEGFPFFAYANSRISVGNLARAIIRAWVLEPEKILTREALTKPHRTVVSQEELARAYEIKSRE